MDRIVDALSKLARGTRACAIFVLCSTAAQTGTPTYMTLFSFTNQVDDGTEPQQTPVIGNGGVLYSTTLKGGTYSGGTVFSLTPPSAPGGSWTEAVLHSFSYFSSTDGTLPSGNLVIDKSGALYGVTGDGGSTGCRSTGCGTVFALAPPSVPGGPWAETVLYNFTAAGDGFLPTGLALGSDGVLYGVTAAGGSLGYGTVFSLKPPQSTGGSWTETVLYNFMGGADGGGPGAPPVLGGGGVLYSTTRAYGGGTGCGGYGCGTVFSLSPPSAHGGAWTETVLHTFGGAPQDGDYPLGTLAIGSGGVLYGTTEYGGAGCVSASGCGTAFSLTPPSSPGGSWTEAVLHNFPGGKGGLYPTAGLALNPETGGLYGTTTQGGSVYPHRGTAFALIPPSSPSGSWGHAALYNFAGTKAGGSGAAPFGGLVMGSGGVLYGTTGLGGTGNGGTVYSLAP